MSTFLAVVALKFPGERIEITVPEGEVSRIEYDVKFTGVPSPNFRLTCFKTVPPADKGVTNPETGIVLESAVAHTLKEFQRL